MKNIINIAGKEIEYKVTLSRDNAKRVEFPNGDAILVHLHKDSERTLESAFLEVMMKYIIKYCI